MSGAVLLDSGPLVALLDRRDGMHRWVLEQMARLRPPFHTCEAVLTEASHLLRHLPRAQASILEMVAGRVIVIPFRLDGHVREVLTMMQRYANVPMSLADACLVRMSELHPESVVFTLDGDFRIYRRHKRRAIPLVMPPEI